jgi:endonuclease-8
VAEGDAVYGAAITLRRWLAGRQITGATSTVAGLPTELLVGRRVTSVEAWGNHLLLRLDSGHALHTHLRMSGSWDVYSGGEPWRRPQAQARLVLTSHDRLAVCFNAPVVELLEPGPEQVHPAGTDRR